MEAHELLDIALEAAQRAGDILLARFGGEPEGVDTKSSPTDVVSDADRASEALLLKIIETRRPDDGILGEEGTGKDSISGVTWVVDPLDGSVNFVFKIPHWAVSVAVEDADGTLVAVVHDPNRAETFTAIRGQGAFLNGTPCRVGDSHDLSQALIGTGFAYDQRVRRAQARVVPRVLGAARDIRRAGAAALDLAWVGCGRLDGFYEAHLMPWDRAAGALIVTAAGGVVSELPAPLDLPAGVVASGPGLHEALRGLVMSEE